MLRETTPSLHPDGAGPPVLPARSKAGESVGVRGWREKAKPHARQDRGRALIAAPNPGDASHMAVPTVTADVRTIGTVSRQTGRSRMV
jgi:hypothetical protein